MFTPAIRAILEFLFAVLSVLGGLTLPLLVARIFTDHAHHAAAPDDLAIAAQLFYRCLNSHCDVLTPSLKLPERYFARKIMRPRDRSYGVNSTVTLSPGRIRM